MRLESQSVRQSTSTGWPCDRGGLQRLVELQRLLDGGPAGAAPRAVGHDAGRHLDVARLGGGDIDRGPRRARHAGCRSPASRHACSCPSARRPAPTSPAAAERPGCAPSGVGSPARHQPAGAGSFTPSGLAWGFSASAIAVLGLGDAARASRRLNARASGPKSPMRCSTSAMSLPWSSISVDRLDRAVGEARLGQDALDPRAIAEGILAGILRPGPRHRRQERRAARIGTRPRDSPAACASR